MFIVCLIAIVLASIGPVAIADVTYVDTFTADLRYPGRLAAAPGGGVYVTEQPTGRVLHYDADGTLVATYAIAELPVGIAVDPTSGDIFVSRRDGEVGIYDASFVLQGTFDPSPFTMSDPNDLAVDAATGEVYVAESGEHQVMVFDGTTGTLLRAWGTEGSGLSELEHPQAIAIDPTLERVIVADVDNFRVQVFDTMGVLQFKFGYRVLYLPSSETAWFARSEGVAIDECGNIYVADALMGTIRAFDSAGTELDPDHLPLVGYGSDPGQLRVPCDVLIDGTTMYVADTNSSSVEVFDVSCSAGIPGPGRGDGGGNRLLPASRGGPAGQGSPRGPGAQAAGFHRSAPLRVDNPFDIVAAISAGRYSPDLDLNRDGLVDIADLDIAVAEFGGATVEDFLGGGAETTLDTYDPPHVIDLPYSCGRCHAMDGLPGGMLSDWGQENLCLSCHTASGLAMARPIGGEGNGNSHAWGVMADAGDVAGPEDGSELALHLDEGKIRCGTCHNPHEYADGKEYLRDPGPDAALCKQCHRGEGAPLDHGDPYTKHCDDCHDPHAIGDNLHLIAEEFETYWFGHVDVSFTDDSVGVGPGAFVDPDPDVRGICEACHDYPSDDPDIVPPHVLDGSMPVCTTCHQHHNGFEPGLGPFPPGEYIGSPLCGACHPGQAELQAVHGHAHKLNPVEGAPPEYPPEGIYAGVPDPPVGATWDDVSYVIGGYYRKARFVTQLGNIMIGAEGEFDGAMGVETQWNLEFPPAGTGLNWAWYHQDDTEAKPYNYSCFQCHTTGPVADGGFEEWAEPAVQCEACHGPGSDHASDPHHELPIIDTSAAQCGTCHTRGSDPLVVLAKGGYIRHHEQWPELLASPHAYFECVTCHEPHTSAYYATAEGIRLYCTDCHVGVSMGEHESETFVRGAYTEELTCVSCHMACATKSAAAADASVVGPIGRMGDIKTHVFNINTDAVDYTAMFTADLSELLKDGTGQGAVTLDFVCLRCHNGIGNAPDFTLQQASDEAVGIH